MGRTLAEVLPLALGAAVSPLLLTATLLVLSGRDRPLARGFAVALGAALPLAALGAIGLIAFRHTVQPDGGGSHSEASAWIDLGLGLLLLVLAAVELRRRPAEKPDAEKPAPQSQSGLWRSALLGLGMMLTNFTTAILYIDAVKEIARSGIEASEQLIVLAAVLAVTLIPVLVPVLAYAIAPGAASRVLGRLGDWVEGHRRAISIALLLGFGLYLTLKGVAELSRALTSTVA